MMNRPAESKSLRKPQKGGRARKVILALAIWAALALGIRMAIQVLAAEPATASFDQTWTRTDDPVAAGLVDRTWLWGPEGFTPAMTEPYAESPGGERTVQYFDKSRMEDNGFRAGSPWDVTNGLLVVELVTGRMQVGDEDFIQYSPAEVNVAGDQDDPSGVEYATLAGLMADPALPDGATITQRVDQYANITSDPSLASYGVTAAERVTVPGIDHQVASPFWAFINSTGTVYENGAYINAPMFLSSFYATGYPITEAYWAEVKVAGVYQDVLMQCFERRCLTYTPGNPEGWQVEAGNVGQHYYAWRNGQIDDEPTPTPPADPTPTPTPPADPTPEPTEMPDPILNYAPLTAFGELWDPGTALDYPQGVAVGGGYVYVAEQVTDRVTKFTTAGYYVDAWYGFDNPSDVEIDRDGNVWVADTNHSVVKKYTPDGTFLTQVGTGTSGCGPGELGAPADIAFTSNGHMLVADYILQRVARFNAAGVYQGALGDAGCAPGLGDFQFDYPHGVAVDASDNIYVVDNQNERVVKYNAAGSYIEEWGRPGGLSGSLPGEFDNPFGIAISTDGYVYVADLGNDRIQILDLGGTPRGEFGQPGTAPGQFGDVIAVDVDADGNVYTVDTDNANVQKFDRRGNFLDVFSDNRRGHFGNTVKGMTLDASGNVYVADDEFNRILKYDLTGGYLMEFGELNTGPARFTEPVALAASLDGYLYVLDAGADRVLKFEQDGDYVTYWGRTGSGSGEFIDPYGIEVDDAGNVYVADTGNDRIQKFTPDGIYIPSWNDPNVTFNAPVDIAIHGADAYVIERDNNRVQRFSLDGVPNGQWGSFGRNGNGQFDGPYGIGADAYGYVYLADTGSDIIQKFDPAGTHLTQFGESGIGPGRLDHPYRVEVSATDHVYVLDAANHRVQIFEPA